MKALQGRVAGVEIVASSNEPGAAMNVRIRGVRSLTASNEPLYVVDGMPICGRHSGFQSADDRVDRHPQGCVGYGDLR